jgi:hypothetical protein
MHFPDKGRLGVFDVNELRVTATLSADTGNARVAAGLTKVVLSAPGFATPHVLRVYDLPT